MKIPIALKADRLGRSLVHILMPIVTELTLRAGSRRLEVKTTVDNRALDHRLRVLFPTPYPSEKVQAGGHFDTIERFVDLTRHPQYSANEQTMLYPTEHLAGFVHLGDERHGLAILTRGLCEYEALAGQEQREREQRGRKKNGQAPKGHTLALTLFRSVGWLSRGDFRRRPGNAGPQIAAPEAQMPGLHGFEYALYPHAGDWTQAQLAQEAQELSQPVMSERGDRHNTSIPADQPERTRPIPREGSLSDTFSLVSLEPGELVLTASKLADEGKDWIVRFYNQAPYDVQGMVEFGFPADKVWLADLSEKRTGAKPIGCGKRIELRVGAKKIVTLAIKF
jgi:alpha-mannosidase